MGGLVGVTWLGSTSRSSVSLLFFGGGSVWVVEQVGVERIDGTGRLLQEELCEFLFLGGGNA